MAERASTSTVAVEYHDPYNLYPLLSPGLLPRLPLRHLHWPSHAGPLRSIDTLLVDLVSAANDSPAASQPRHQLPGLRRTPYLKLLLVRCDDNETYKSTVRAEIREWIKTNTVSASSASKKVNNQEKHDACEWLIVHVVIPNTVAATQPRTSSTKSEIGTTDKSTSSRWRSGSTPLLEKLRSDFNTSGKGSADRVAQIRIGINDVPYSLLPRVVPAVPTGYSETEHDAENAWNELVGKLKSLILQSFDMRVTQYEEDLKERDAQRSLPGWNFCTFFILKEGLAQGFESVGLVEDALVGYDELSVGLDLACVEQAESTTGLALPTYTEELQQAVEAAAAEVFGNIGDSEEAVDLQSQPSADGQLQGLALSAARKPYRSMIPENKVSLFDFRCYIFSRQVELLLRLANASSTRDELLSKLKEQQESILYGEAPMAQPSSQMDEGPEDLAKLADICQRTLEFIPSISQIMRSDIITAWAASEALSVVPCSMEIVDNMVSSFAFSVAQQIIAQTSTQALPIPPSTIHPRSADEQKASIPEPKTMMHPARDSSLATRTISPPPPSPGFFPGSGTASADRDARSAHFAKAGLEDLAAKRADLYMLSRSVLDTLGCKRSWSTGWPEAPLVGDDLVGCLEDIDLDADTSTPETQRESEPSEVMLAGIRSHLLQTAVDTVGDFYRLYETLTDKALRHYSVAGHEHSVHANLTDLAVLKYHLKDHRAAAEYFPETTPFFGERGWSLLELSMLVMYSQCLRALQDDDGYVRVALKLLIKTCAAEHERLQEKKSTRAFADKKQYPDRTAVVGVINQLLELAQRLKSERKASLSHFIAEAEVDGTVQYADGSDSCVLGLSAYSLLSEDINLDSVSLRASSVDGNSFKEITLRAANVVLRPGRNNFDLHCNTVVPGRYSIDRLVFQSGQLTLDWGRDAAQPPDQTETLFRRPEIVLYQQAAALNLELNATRDTALDKDNSLELRLETGWNDLQSCDINVKPATGGLRLLTTEAVVVSAGVDFAKHPEAGAFVFEKVPPNQIVTIRFPYTMEQDIADVQARLDIAYTNTSGKKFHFSKTTSVTVTLALGVNVQDVFKHQALFSRFNVTTASMSPLRLLKSELLESELFKSTFGPTAESGMTIFPRQSASLLYRVDRKQTANSNSRLARTMYLKLHYRSLQDEVEALLLASLRTNLANAGLVKFARAVCDRVIAEFRSGLQPTDLERAALIGSITTTHLATCLWERHFSGFGKIPASKDSVASRLASFLRDWQARHTSIRIVSSSKAELSSILIPVEIPSVSIVHTADIKLADAAALAVNQPAAAVLHLKWTRQWHTHTTQKDLEYSYEVGVSSDTWLLGGRRKGHFVIPVDAAISSTPETEAEIPLILIPLREGWLPYPAVEIREVSSLTATVGQPEEVPQQCEVDFKNVGETLRVLDPRAGVTVSLDASGPAGGPLVLDTQSAARTVA